MTDDPGRPGENAGADDAETIQARSRPERRFGAARLRPRIEVSRNPTPRRPATTLPSATVTRREPDGPALDDGGDLLPAGDQGGFGRGQEFPSGQGLPLGGEPREFAGGRVRVYGCSPGCLVLSLAVSLILSLLLSGVF